MGFFGAVLNTGLSIASTSITTTNVGVIDWAGWITAIMTAVLASAAWYGLCSESRRYRFSQNVELILKLDEKFNSPQFLEKRSRAAKCLRDKSYKDDKSDAKEDADDVLDFFETVQFLLKRGALDEETVWHT